MAKTNFAMLSIDNRRMTDVEYIQHLENVIRQINSQVEEFIQVMDKSIFDKRPLHEILGVYTENVHKLRFK